MIHPLQWRATGPLLSRSVILFIFLAKADEAIHLIGSQLLDLLLGDRVDPEFVAVFFDMADQISLALTAPVRMDLGGLGLKSVIAQKIVMVASVTYSESGALGFYTSCLCAQNFAGLSAQMLIH